MANRTQVLKQGDINKAIRALTAAGVRDPTVTITKPDGTTVVIGGSRPVDANVTAPKPESDADLDRELKDWEQRRGGPVSV